METFVFGAVFTTELDATMDNALVFSVVTTLARAEVETDAGGRP